MEIPNNVNTAEYGINQIKTLEGIEAIRLRAGMYIGSVGPEGVKHITLEIISNAVDEYLNGHCTECHVNGSNDNVIEIIVPEVKVNKVQNNRITKSSKKNNKNEW